MVQQDAWRPTRLIEGRFIALGYLWWKKYSCQSCWCLVKPRHAENHVRVCVGHDHVRNPGKPENVREQTVVAQVRNRIPKGQNEPPPR